MPDFRIVDSHVHLYDPATLAYPWLKSVPAIDRASALSPGTLTVAVPSCRDRARAVSERLTSRDGH